MLTMRLPSDNGGNRVIARDLCHLITDINNLTTGHKVIYVLSQLPSCSAMIYKLKVTVA